jgi:hypothetical protein
LPVDYGMDHKASFLFRLQNDGGINSDWCIWEGTTLSG